MAQAVDARALKGGSQLSLLHEVRLRYLRPRDLVRHPPEYCIRPHAFDLVSSSLSLDEISLIFTQH